MIPRKKAMIPLNKRQYRLWKRFYNQSLRYLLLASALLVAVGVMQRHQ